MTIDCLIQTFSASLTSPYRHLPYYDADRNQLNYGAGSENFVDAKGNVIDVQYVQAAFAATKKGDGNASYSGVDTILVFETVSLLGLRSPPWAESSEGYISNRNGTALGLKAASLGTLAALYEDICDICGK